MDERTGQTSDARARFDVLRAKYLTARRKVLDREAVLASKYGGGFQTSWLSAAEAKRLTRERAAADAASSAFMEHLTATSPRDWSYGVPAHWLYERLTFEDAVRPVGEKLSVVPPLSYGAKVPRS